MKITNAKEARENIGKQVFWDDHGTRYIFLRCGILEDYHKLHVCIDGDYKPLRNLTDLRTTEEIK